MVSSVHFCTLHHIDAMIYWIESVKMGIKMNQRERDMVASRSVQDDFDRMIRENFYNHPNYHLFLSNTSERLDMFLAYAMGRASA